MEQNTFEAELTRDGYTPVRIEMEPNLVKPEHRHPFDARLLVVAGALTIARADAPTRTYAVGDTFEMPMGTEHAETAGDAGAVYIAGRRFKAG